LTKGLISLGYTTCKGSEREVENKECKDKCVYSTPEVTQTYDESSNNNEILIQLDVQRPIPNLETGAGPNDAGRGFKSESASMHMAGAIGGIGLMLLVVVLISSAIAKKKNSRQNCDNKEELEYDGYDENYYDYARSSTFSNLQATKDTICLETMTNPYYGGNEYIVIHGKPGNTLTTSDKVNTIKIVNNEYYE